MPVTLSPTPKILHTIETALSAAERRTIASVIRSHPEWTMDYLARLLASAGDRERIFGSLTVGEILTAASEHGPAEPPIDSVRLAAAKRAKGPTFDALVLTAVSEAPGPVGAGYLRPRVGGPRWKLAKALARLTAEGKLSRSGTTSGTRYTTTGSGS